VASASHKNHGMVVSSTATRGRRHGCGTTLTVEQVLGWCSDRRRLSLGRQSGAEVMSSAARMCAMASTTEWVRGRRYEDLLTV
jgi:hypothetical protein